MLGVLAVGVTRWLKRRAEPARVREVFRRYLLPHLPEAATVRCESGGCRCHAGQARRRARVPRAGFEVRGTPRVADRRGSVHHDPVTTGPFGMVSANQRPRAAPVEWSCSLAMPTLTDPGAAVPVLHRLICWRKDSNSAITSARLPPSSTTPNSSPPSRATHRVSPNACCSLSASNFNASSPARWPSLSLIA